MPAYDVPDDLTGGPYAKRRPAPRHRGLAGRRAARTAGLQRSGGARVRRGRGRKADREPASGFRLNPESVEQIQFSGDFGEYATAGEAVGTLIGQAQLKLAKFTVVETRDVEVRGATTAQVVRYTILDNANSQLSGTWIVAAHWPYPQSVAISILTPQHDPELERQVLDSMRMRPVLS